VEKPIARIPSTNTSCYLTVKGKSDVHGVTRYEWEKEIAREDAEELLKLCEPGVTQISGHFFSQPFRLFKKFILLL